MVATSTPAKLSTSIAAETLTIGISASALFDTRASDEFYRTHTRDEYVAYQINNENEHYAKGTAFHLVSALLQLNAKLPKRARGEWIELVVLSKNEPDAGLRVLNSLDHYGFKHVRAAFTGGEPVARYCGPFDVSLFLSREEAEVKDALKRGIAAGVLYDPPDVVDLELDQVRIAFDWDGVLGNTDAEVINMTEGLEAFRKHETDHVLEPCPAGPFEPVLRVLATIRAEITKAGPGVPPIEIALVTARNPPAHKRVILTLRHWGVRLDQLFLLGGKEKKPLLAEFRPHIFFEDQEKHAGPASKICSTVRVPWTTELPLPVTTYVAKPAIAPVPVSVTTDTATTKTIRYPSMDDFEGECRGIFGKYTPKVGNKARPLDERFRDFIKANRGRSGKERAAILERLREYDLQLPDHDPMLNRERGDFLVARLKSVASGKDDDGQGELGLGGETQ